ncbi:AzlC family ABC transporter permease [Pseudomonas sp. FME51]|uniref:AzlC family ABC transporter permease n=1 Tax=Pseudomonas sp. FME51 TaxID=2742609 RepID=UPI0018686F04|nr:AzlC family ABC transporter permease [Pseudomonas sp. FME51]
MPDSTVNLHEFNRQDIWEGFKQLVPIAIFVIAFGAAFGLAATQTDLSPSLSMFMSTLVFAGASQFAALELWGAQIPVVPLALTVLAINARHLLMGASLYPWLRYLSPAKRYGIMLVASDANWVMSVQAFHRGQPGFGLLFGGGLALWSFWIFGTWLGIYFGGAIQDPTLYGLDMVMGCFLLAMAVGGDKSLRLLIIWAVAACSALLAYWYLPENSHVVVGALAGGVLGAVWMEKHQ